MMVFAQCYTVGWMVVERFREGDEMARLDQGKFSKSHADAAGSAAIVVHLFNGSRESLTPHGVLFVLLGGFGSLRGLLQEFASKRGEEISLSWKITAYDGVS